MEEEVIDPWWKRPLMIILSLFLLLIITTWTFAIYGGRVDPEPSAIPSIGEVVPTFVFENLTHKVFGPDDYYRLVNPSDPLIKGAADLIVTYGCDGNKVCQAKSIYYFIRDKYRYISDPITTEYVKDPMEFLVIGGGDCEDGTIALANLLGAIGIRTEFVFSPNHVFLKAYLPEATKRYQKDGWVYLDWTCHNCKFGEISPDVAKYI